MIARRLSPSSAAAGSSTQIQVIRPSARSLVIPDGFPPPPSFGLPESFPTWRAAQLDAVNRIVDSRKRFKVVCAPTGVGKSLIGMAASMLSGHRSVSLTSTLGLADQYKRSFSSIAADVRGMSNYLCNAAQSLSIPVTTTASDAPCHCGYRCRLRLGGCDYFDAYHRAQAADIVTTTYQCWMYDALKDPTEALHDPNPDNLANAVIAMLVCDEASDAIDEIQRFITISITRRECLHLHLEWPDHLRTATEWSSWATKIWPDICARVARAEQSIKSGGGRSNGNSNGGGWVKELKLLREMARKLGRLSTIAANAANATNDAASQWIVSPHQDPDSRAIDAMEFIPLDLSKFAEEALWRNVPNVVLLSATIRPKTVEMLGIPAASVDFIEYPSTFSAARRPIIVVPSVMLSHRTEQDDDVMIKWLAVIESIIAGRLDRKGIAHAVSYGRAKFLFDNSAYQRLMLIHGRRDRAQVINEFIDSLAPRILVSPSITTGYDFADDLARYSIIAKLPFQSVTDPVVKARQAIDPDYGIYLTSKDILQASGRIMRGELDWGETFIVDDSFRNWFFKKARKFFPDWWLEAIIWADGVPPPPPIIVG